MGAATRPVSRKEYRRLLRLLDKRTALAVQISAETGLRVSDVLGITVGALKRAMDVLERKTGKVRHVRLSEKTYAAAKALASDRPDDEQLIKRNRSTIYRHIKEAAGSLGLEHVSMHSFRKLFARGFAAKYGLMAAQAELRHKYVSTTLLYVVDATEVQEMLRQEVTCNDE